jgi:hypothetical protein
MANPARVPHADRVAVLHRIEVKVIEVPREIVLVAQCVLPIPPLPNPALASGGATGRDSFDARQSMRKAAFDQAPARGEMRIAIGQVGGPRA